MSKQSRRPVDEILTAEELLDTQSPAAAVDTVKEARRKARRLKERARRRHRMRLVDDIIERLLGHRSYRPSKRLQEQLNLLTEDITAENWERAIVIAFNGGWDRAPQKYGLQKAEYKKVEPIASRIAKDIKQQTGTMLRDQMLHFGTGGGESIQMVNWWKGKNTPKTDCYTSSGVRVSLKKQGGSQLMSGLQNETLSTFEAAKRYMETQADATAQVDSLLKVITPALSRRLRSGEFNINTIAQLADDIEAYDDLSPEDKKSLAYGGIKSKEDLQNLVQDTLKFKRGQEKVLSSVDRKKLFDLAKELVGLRQEFRTITPLVADWFESNPEFKMWFTYEAASGHMKFLPAPKASANWIVEFDPELGTKNKINRLEARGSSKTQIMPSDYVKELAFKTTFRISFKTSSGSERGGQTAASLRTTEFLQTEGTKRAAKIPGLMEFAESTWNSLVETQMLTEDIGQTLQDVFSKVKKTVRDWVTRIVQKLREIAAQGLSAFMNFLGLVPQTVEVDGIDMLFSE